MNKRELATELAHRTGSTVASADNLIRAFMETVSETLARDEKVQLAGFGTFEARHRSARKGKNPRTGADMIVPAAKVPSFKAGKTFKDKLLK